MTRTVRLYAPGNHADEIASLEVGFTRWRWFGLGVRRDFEDLTFSVGLWFGSAYLSFPSLRARYDRSKPMYGQQREWSLRVLADGDAGPYPCILGEFGTDPDESRSNDRRSFFLDTERVIFGSVVYGLADLTEPSPIVVHMPEGDYQGVAQMQERTVTWQRFGRSSRHRFVAVSFAPKGIPVPGKGENSYDCGEDAIISTGFDVEGLGRDYNLRHDLAASYLRCASFAMRESVLQTRARYGGGDGTAWRPEKATA
jgi:hypothetical protein